MHSIAEIAAIRADVYINAWKAMSSACAQSAFSGRRAGTCPIFITGRLGWICLLHDLDSRKLTKRAFASYACAMPAQLPKIPYKSHCRLDKALATVLRLAETIVYILYLPKVQIMSSDSYSDMQLQQFPHTRKKKALLDVPSP